MADSFQLEIVTPDKLVVDDRATEAQIPARNGYIGVLPLHAPLITELAVGVITYKNVKGETHHIAVVHVWHLHDGKVVKFEPYIDTAAMLKVLGK